jgi:hypothetical protein
MVLAFPVRNHTSSTAQIKPRNNLTLGQFLPPHPPQHRKLEAGTVVTKFLTQSGITMLAVDIDPTPDIRLVDTMFALKRPIA